ncbi:AAA family ATPase [Salinimicrobium sp. TH3]|uniref:AAA family ATPase n=1 Tax=Salinimicrobium sp. TH3 TaxID=2997342 RepID=UPI002274EB80|nr:AAA family ATPase [Salinimicrobium sp. TH3]MCY2685948.1 AAA family ATPase [Salinimicrobium sp. TH3]
MPGLPTISKPANRLLGRNREFKKISEILWDSQKTSLLIVEGPAGIGKTSLIKHVLEENLQKNFFKLYGKFQNNRGDTPYSAFRQAFTLWSQQILLLSDKEFDELRENATSALQTHIRVITSVFPDLEVFFNRKHLVQYPNKVDSHQIKARFYYFLKKFFKSITALGYEVVLFLDDLQWADRASLDLLEELTGKQIGGLRLVAAYRPHEDPSSALSQPLGNIFTGSKVKLIRLEPFPRSVVPRMIPPEWNFSKENLASFSNYLWMETEGNPFGIQEIIKAVESRDLLSLGPGNPLFWERLPRLGGEKDSVVLIREQIRALPFHQQKLIAAASCLGFYFTPEALQNIYDPFDKESRKSLGLLSTRGLLIKKGTTYVFAHDHVFSAANSLLSNSEKCDLHLKAAVYMLKVCGDYQNADLFNAVNHLNRTKELAGSGKIYSKEIVLLNIQAARLAINNSAFETALGYIQNADKFFRESEKPIRIKDPALQRIFEAKKLEIESIGYLIFYGYAETNFLLQRFEIALSYAQKVLDLNGTRHQRVKAMLIKIRICSALMYQKNTSHLLEHGLSSFAQILGEFGIHFPFTVEKMEKENMENCSLLQEKAAAYTEKTDFTRLLNPDKEYQDLLKLITTSLTFLYYLDVRKHLYLTIRSLLLIVEKGHTPVSPVLFSASFVISSLSRENRDLAYFLGRLSLKMIENDPFKRYSHIIYYVGTLNFFAWNNHYRICSKKLKESVVKAYEAGDPHYAAFCSTNIRLLDCYRGRNLLKHMEATKRFEKNYHIFFISSSDDDLTNYLVGTKQGLEKGKFRFSKDLLRQSEQNLNSRYHLNLALQKLNYIAGYNEAALKAGKICESLGHIYKGFQIELEHFFFYSLSRLQAAYSNPESFPEVLSSVQPKLEEFQRLTAFGSGNYLHKVYLLQAEIAKCRGDFEEATLLYDRAIEQAQKMKFTHHAAIAAELAFKYYHYKNRTGLAKHYLEICLKNYKRWGAMAKVDQLQTKYGYLTPKKKRSQEKIELGGHYETIKKILRRNVPSGNIILEELGQYLLNLLIKDLKAKKGGIFILKDNNWQVLASKSLGVRVEEALKDLREKLPVSVLNYIIKKGEKLLLQELLRESLFAEDEYLREQQPGNITIIPVKQSAETIAIFYLEDCRIDSEAEKDLFPVKLELACTTFTNAVYYENTNLLNKQLKLQERNRIEAVIESQEKERQRIAEELHDSLGQILALTRINLSRIQPTDTASENEELLKNISDLIDESCEEVRSISHNLMPPDLNNRGIADILQKLIAKNRVVNGIEYKFYAERLESEPSAACKFTLYRVLQEIIQNIIKHASATKVNVSLTETGDLLHLLVEDNGKGFDTSVTGFGLGLKNIYSRIKLLNGYLDIDSSINSGTVFNITIPLKI